MLFCEGNLRVLAADGFIFSADVIVVIWFTGLCGTTGGISHLFLRCIFSAVVRIFCHCYPEFLVVYIAAALIFRGITAVLIVIRGAVTFLYAFTSSTDCSGGASIIAFTAVVGVKVDIGVFPRAFFDVDGDIVCFTYLFTGLCTVFAKIPIFTTPVYLVTPILAVSFRLSIFIFG